MTTTGYLDAMTGRGPFERDETVSQHNIVLITLDMVPMEFYRDVGASIAPRTPNLDALWREGAFFSNAFCTSPLCSPSRASYLTGRYSYITTNSERSHDGHTVHLRENDSIFPEYLKAAGYHVRHVGKSHVGTHRYMDVFGENDAPWNRWSPPWYDDDDYVNFMRAQGLARFDFERRIVGQSISGEGEGNFYGGWIAPQDDKPFPKTATYPAFLVQRAIDALAARPQDGRPFYLQLDFFGPHQPFAIPVGYETRERELRKSVRLPQSYQRLLENDFQASQPEPRVYRTYRRSLGMRDPETAKDYLVAHVLQFELLDEMIGQMLDYLKAMGCYDETWVIYASDHGEMNCEEALIDKGAFLNPRTIAVPIVIKPPVGVSDSFDGSEVAQPVSLLDLAPTMLALAGITVPELCDGQDLLATLSGAPRPEDKPILFEIWSHVVPNPSIGLVFQARDGRHYMYTFNLTDDVDELYLLADRPGLHNLIADEQSGSIRLEALHRMRQVLRADPRWRGYVSAFVIEYAKELSLSLGDTQIFFGLSS